MTATLTLELANNISYEKMPTLSPILLHLFELNNAIAQTTILQRLTIVPDSTDSEGYIYGISANSNKTEIDIGRSNLPTIHLPTPNHKIQFIIASPYHIYVQNLLGHFLEFAVVNQSKNTDPIYNLNGLKILAIVEDLIEFVTKIHPKHTISKPQQHTSTLPPIKHRRSTM